MSSGTDEDDKEDEAAGGKLTAELPITRDRIPIVYRPEYGVRFLGLQKLHPFDAAKGGNIYRLLKTISVFTTCHFSLQPHYILSLFPQIVPDEPNLFHHLLYLRLAGLFSRALTCGQIKRGRVQQAGPRYHQRRRCPPHETDVGEGKHPVLSCAGD